MAANKNKKNKEKKKKSNKKRISTYALIVLQAVFAALIGVCFFSYKTSSELLVMESPYNYYYYVPEFGELRGDYFKSDIYLNSYKYYIEEAVNYSVTRSDLETDGKYDGEKLVYLNDYMDPLDAALFNMEIPYKLDDLIEWGESENGVNVVYKTFDSWADYYNFFGSATGEDAELEELQETYGAELYSETRVPMVETVTNTYLSATGNALEYYATDENEYGILRDALITATTELSEESSLYLQYQDEFSESNTNIRYYVSFEYNGEKETYTNVPLITVRSSDSAVYDTFKEFGQYLYIEPDTLGYNTNIPLEYDEVKELISDYAYLSKAKIWVSLDTDFPVEDVFSINKATFDETASYVPWYVLIGALSIIGFLGLFPVVIRREKRDFAAEGNSILSEFDRLPIEVSLLFFLLLILIIIIGETVLVWNVSAFNNLSSINLPSLLLVFIDMAVVLVFFYGYVRRILCKNFKEGSLIAIAAPFFKKLYDRLRTKLWFYYDDSNIAFRTWASYILFLLINTFFATMLFYSNYQVASFVILLIFDLVVGFVMSGRNDERRKIITGIRKISEGDYTYQIDADRMHGDNKELADAVNEIGNGIEKAVETSTKDEKLKASLITNVSHDLKTPLTSIINYVGLLKREKIDNENAKKYINVLDEKSQRLKTLTFDLIEASKITSGNISLDNVKLNINDLLIQCIGEFDDKFEEKHLEVVREHVKTPVYIYADPRYMFRIMENLFSNIYKYALENTRVYIDLNQVSEKERDFIRISIKNISEQKLNIPAEELTERFIRGDVARSTEGSGLGLSIAKSLTLAQEGDFNTYLDGDLFKVTLTFPILKD